MQKRLNYVDMVKGLCALMVVFYHLTAPCGFKTVLDHLTESALIAFFFFSGYFHRPGKRTLGENLMTRVKAIMIPFLKYTLFFWAVGTIVLIATGKETFIESLLCLRNFFAGSIWNRTIQNWFGWDYYSLGKRYMFLADFWFLIALMLASIVFLLIIDHVIRSKAKTLVTAGVLIAVTGVLRYFAIDLPYNLQIVPFWAAILMLGAFAGNYKLFDIPKFSAAHEWVFGGISLAAGIAIDLVKEPCRNVFRGTFGENEVVSMLLCLLSALLFIWGLGLICKRIECANIRVKELSWLGSHSLLIYIYHMFIAWIISQITGFSLSYEDPSDPLTITLSILLGVGCLVICILRYVVGDKITAAIKANREGKKKALDKAR